jgi:hypothetical protein
MSERDWLVEELTKHKKDHKWVYISIAIGICLIIGLAVFFVFTAKNNKSVTLTDTQASNTSTDSQQNIQPSSNQNTTPSSTSTQNSVQSTAPTISVPNISNTTPTPVVYTPPAAATVNCAAIDTENLNFYSSGLFSDLITYENGVVPDAAVLGYTQILNDINNNILTANKTSQNTYLDYVSEDQLHGCVPSLSEAYFVPDCTNLSLCISEIPNVP